MKYHLTGAHKESAVDVELILEADSEEAASAAAGQMSMMVEKIEPVVGPSEDDVMRHEYHTLRCDFRDLNTHLNKYAADYWRVRDIHHDARDANSVYAILERMHRVAPDSKY